MERALERQERERERQAMPQHTKAIVRSNEGKKQLRRSSSDAMIGGVAGGLGEYFGIDPVWIRAIFVALTLSGIGAPILGYLIACIIIRPDTYQKALPAAEPETKDPDEVPEELVEAWKEVNEITEGR